jgi:tetratricopeptide (TPR) repeat protein
MARVQLIIHMAIVPNSSIRGVLPIFVATTATVTPMTANALSEIASELNRGLVHHQQGELDQAQRAYRNVLKQIPEDAAALRLLATLEMQRGRHAEAFAIAGRALAASPGDAATQNTMGQVLCAQGRFDEAHECFSAAVSIDPKLANARANLGRCQLRTGQLQAGIEALCAAAELEPGDASLACEIATLLNGGGDTAGAERYFLLALEWAPDKPVSYINLGAFYIDQDRPETAVPLLTRALEIDAQAPSAWMNLSRALRMLGELAAALECIDHLLKLQSLDAGVAADAVAFAGSIHHQGGDYDAARDCFERVLREHPDHVMARQGLAELHEWRGEYAEAIECLSAVVASDNRPPEPVVTFARALRRAGRREEAIRLLEAQLRDDHTAGRCARPLLKQLHFTLAALYDDEAQYDAAWHHVSKANALAPNTFDMTQHNAAIERIIARGCAGSAGGDTGATDTHPVFIVGMPRSGTSLIEQILAAHPHVHAIGESGCIAASLSDNYPYTENQPAAADIERVRESFAAHAESMGEGTRCIVEKTPLNFLLLDIIERSFPNARIVHCRRDARDTLLSCYFTDFRAPGLSFANDLEALGEYYENYQRLMAHWRAHISIPVLELSYEQLVNDPEPHVRELVRFAGLEWDDRCLCHERVRNVVHTASHAQVREPIYTRAVERWRNYAEYLSGMPELG